jgi:SAM-dependent methyltransferase
MKRKQEMDLSYVKEKHPFTVRDRKKDIEWLRYVEPHIKNLKNPKILDAGCLFGDFLTLMPKNIVGVDIIAEAVKICKKRNLNAVISDLSGKLPFSNNSFDFIHSWMVVEHLDRETNYNSFDEFYRILKDGGKLVVMTGDIKKLKWNFIALTIDHVTFFSKESLYEIARRSGFKKIKISYLPFQRGNGILLKIFSPKTVMKIQDTYKKIGITGKDIVLEAWK